MFNDPKGPVEHYSWGKFIIRGEEHSLEGDVRKGKGKDIRLVGEEVKRWKDRKGHMLNQSMVEKAIDKDIDIVVIGNGADGALIVPEDVVSYLLENGIKEVIVEKTPEACKIYNGLFHDGKKVALFAHGTC